VGASAGGVEALSELVSSLKGDFPAPLVIAQHLDPTRPSYLNSILSRHTNLPVVTVEDSTPLVPATVYVVPANRHVSISDHTVTVEPDGHERPKPSIDQLLKSAAETFGEQLIAVILTGLGSDGTMGARAVKREGGTVIIQNPATAAFPSMPRSLAPNTVDIVADLPRIGSILSDLLAGVYVPTRSDEEGQLQDFLGLLRDRNGIDFHSYRSPTILRRLQRRIVATNTEDLADYRRYLEAHPEEYHRLISSFLIKVTQFMRDTEVFQVVRHELLPDLIDQARRRGNILRLWSAGCATGEEAYSLAILAAEALGDELSDFSVKVFATDLDAEAITFARQGLYPADALEGLPDSFVERYFNTNNGHYEVKKRIRGLIVFGEHDLAQRAPFPNIDMVMCRNVLIYFSKELQQRTLQLFAFSLRKSGYLVLGKTETTGTLGNYFVVHRQQPRVYRREGERMLIPPPRLHQAMPSEGSLFLPQSSRSPLTSIARTQQELQRSRDITEQILERLPVGVVILGRRYSIRQINMAARRLLGIHGVALGADLVHLVDSIPSRDLRKALDTAFTEGTTAGVDEVAVQDSTTGTANYLQITCYPQPVEKPDGKVEEVLVLVSDITSLVNSRQGLLQSAEEKAAHAQKLADAVAELTSANQNLHESRLQVQGMLAQVAGTGTQSEELAHAVSELTTANVELRASLVRAREEQAELARRYSLAEETAAQQNARVQQLVEVNRAVTTANEELLRLNEAERTTSEQYLISNEEAQASTEEVETLNEELQATNEELETLNEELQSTVEELNASNADLEARSMELQTLATSLEQQRQATEDERARLSAMLSSMSDAVVVVDASGTPLLTNIAYQDFFGPEGIVGVLEDEQGHPIAASMSPIARAAQGETFSMTVSRATPSGERHWFEANGRPVFRGSEPMWGVVVIRDITERSLRRLQEEFLGIASHELRTPLTVVLGYLSILTKTAQEKGEERMHKSATAALSAANALKKLIDELLDVARLESGKLPFVREPVQLQEILEQSVEVAQILSDTQEIKLEAQRAPMVVEGDPGRLQQAILNLLNNAITHASESARIDVRLRRAGNLAEIDVQDYGPGIPEEEIPNLFTRFYQVQRGSENVTEGLGLGLFICNQIVAAHGGSISVASLEGKGTTFTVRLPLAKTSEPGKT
jgi:two-component system, chemotaxis family, CheB/CheR fusion protein